MPLAGEKLKMNNVPEENIKNVDWSVLDAYYQVMGDDTDAFLVELVQTFLPNAQKLVNDLNGSLEKKDLTSFHRGAHTLKSSSASLGAMALSEMAKKLEADTVENFPEESGDRVKAIQSELDRVTPEYQAFLKKKTEG